MWRAGSGARGTGRGCGESTRKGCSGRQTLPCPLPHRPYTPILQALEAPCGPPPSWLLSSPSPAPRRPTLWLPLQTPPSWALCHLAGDSSDGDPSDPT